MVATPRYIHSILELLLRRHNHTSFAYTMEETEAPGRSDHPRMWNVRTDLQHMSPDEIKTLYSEHSNSVAVGCLNLSGDINIGIMMRTASLFAVGRFYILGRKYYDRRSSVGTQHHIPVERIYVMKGRDNEFLDEDSALETLISLQQHYTIVFVEQSPQSVPLKEIHSIPFKNPPLFLFGSESNGIPPKLLGLPNTHCVVIPQPGIGRSHNVSIACGIVLYEWFR